MHVHIVNPSPYVKMSTCIHYLRERATIVNNMLQKLVPYWGLYPMQKKVMSLRVLTMMYKFERLIMFNTFE